MESGGRPSHTDPWESGALHDREALLSTVEKIVGVGTWVWDVKLGHVAWSRELFRLLGYDPDRDEASSEAFFAAIHPEDAERVVATSKESAATGQTPTVDCRVLRPNGEIRFVKLDAIAIHDEAGALSRFIGTVLDTTESLARERELARTAALLNLAQQIGRSGSFYWDPESERLEWSEGLYGIFGVAPALPASQALFFSLVHPEDRARVEGESHRAREAGGGRTEFRVVTPAGTVRWVVAESRLIHGPGAPTLIGTVLDVTERKQLEEELRHAQKMEAIGRLAGGIAHDFNNILAVIQGSVELVKRKVPASELEDILQATSRAAALTRQLLAFGRRAVVKPQVLDLNAAVVEAARLVRRLIGEDIRVQLALEEQPCRVLFDVAQIEQVLLNLVLNARDAMPDGGSLTLSTRNVVAKPTGSNGSGEHVLLSVADTGVGMDESIRAKIFEPFFTTKPHGQGTGLGLATVFGIVNQAGGFIEVASALGEGSRFDVFLPRVRDERQAAPNHDSIPVVAGDERILLVEDDERVREVIRRMLADAGYRVLSVADPEQALALASSASEPFDLLVTDLVLPGMSGRALARHLTARQRVRSLLYMTGHGSRDAEDHPPAAAYLHKPFSQRDLLRAARHAIESALADGSAHARSSLA